MLRYMLHGCFVHWPCHVAEMTITRQWQMFVIVDQCQRTFKYRCSLARSKCSINQRYLALEQKCKQNNNSCFCVCKLQNIAWGATIDILAIPAMNMCISGNISWFRVCINVCSLACHISIWYKCLLHGDLWRLFLNLILPHIIYKWCIDMNWSEHMQPIYTYRSSLQYCCLHTQMLLAWSVTCPGLFSAKHKNNAAWFPSF